MAEDGIDISGQTSNNIEEYFAVSFDYVITVCDHAKESCPYFPTQAINCTTTFLILQKRQVVMRKLWSNLETREIW